VKTADVESNVASGSVEFVDETETAGFWATGLFIVGLIVAGRWEAFGGNICAYSGKRDEVGGKSETFGTTAVETA
jgi:hypothetical protein